jgi:hypothetical protein
MKKSFMITKKARQELEVELKSLKVVVVKLPQKLQKLVILET